MRTFSLSMLATKIFRRSTTSKVAQVDHISIDQAWCRRSPRGDLVSAAYVTITNTGTTADRLLSATSEASGRVEFWEMFIDKGDLKMRQRSDGIEIPAGMTIDFHATGYHIMLLELGRPLRVEDRVEGAMIFECAGLIRLDYEVKNGWSSRSSSTELRRSEASVAAARR